jgi:hypothetical protein
LHQQGVLGTALIIPYLLVIADSEAASWIFQEAASQEVLLAAVG